MFIVMSILFMAALVSTLMVSPVQAEGSILSRSWIGCSYRGYDMYYGANVYAYEEGSTAILAVTVHNHYGTPIDVSAVKVGFDWGINYSLTLEPVVEMQSGETRIFTVTFIVPSTTLASDLFLHGYTIYVEHTLGTMEELYYTPPDFAVYSSVQADAKELYQILSAMPSYYFYSVKARLLMNKATNETNTGGILYSRGDFDGAKEHYQTALDLINQAFSAEEDRGMRREDAEIKQLESMANFFNGISTFSLVFGVATVLFAIGYIIRGLAILRKPTPPK